jgi:hypothetical protein
MWFTFNINRSSIFRSDTSTDLIVRHNYEYFYRFIENRTCLGFTDSLRELNITFLDYGNEAIWRYVPAHRTLKTVQFDSLSQRIKNYFVLPKGGGVWIEGPKSVLDLHYLNYKFYSCGSPLLTRRNAATGRLEIFIRQVWKYDSPVLTDP